MIEKLQLLLEWQVTLMQRCRNEWERQHLEGKVEMLKEIIKLMEVNKW